MALMDGRLDMRDTLSIALARIRSTYHFTFSWFSAFYRHGRLAMLATMELARHSAQNSIVPGFDGLDNLITGLPFLYK
jgi:hypothetical protein